MTNQQQQNHTDDKTNEGSYNFLRLTATFILSGWLGGLIYYITQASIDRERNECGGLFQNAICHPMDYAVFQLNLTTLIVTAIATIIVLLMIYGFWLLNKKPIWSRVIVFASVSMTVLTIGVASIFAGEVVNNHEIPSRDQRLCVEGQIERYMNQEKVDDCGGATQNAFHRPIESLPDMTNWGNLWAVMLWVGYSTTLPFVLPNLHRR